MAVDQRGYIHSSRSLRKNAAVSLWRPSSGNKRFSHDRGTHYDCLDKPVDTQVKLYEATARAAPLHSDSIVISMDSPPMDMSHMES